MFLRAFVQGIRETRRAGPLVFFFYGAGLVPGTALAFLLYLFLNSFAGSSIMLGRLAEGWDFDLFFEFLAGNSSAMSGLLGTALVAYLAAHVFYLFFAGGALTLFLRGEGWSVPLFWQGSALLFARFFRLFLWSLPLYAAAFLVQFAAPLAVRILAGSDPPGDIAFWGGAAMLLLAACGMMLASLVVEFARIHTVAVGEWRMSRALWQGLRFVLKHLPGTFGLGSLTGLLGFAIMAGGVLATSVLLSSSWMLLLTMFLLQQLAAFLRAGLRLSLYGGQVYLSRIFDEHVEEVPEFSTAAGGAIPLP